MAEPSWLRDPSVNWYYVGAGKQQVGPVTIERLAMLHLRGAADGGISDDTLCWLSTDGDRLIWAFIVPMAVMLLAYRGAAL